MARYRSRLYIQHTSQKRLIVTVRFVMQSALTTVPRWEIEQAGLERHTDEMPQLSPQTIELQSRIESMYGKKALRSNNAKTGVASLKEREDAESLSA